MNATPQHNRSHEPEPERPTHDPDLTRIHITDIRTVAVPVCDQDRALEFQRDAATGTSGR
jgi:hypothetical protein